jgi:SAM-dependent methyltransferase
MTSWNDGYTSSIPYATTFYRELSPTFLRFAIESEGKRTFFSQGDMAYCELGCGQGFGTALLAASNPHMRFVGIDFNPAHIATATHQAMEAGLKNLAFHDYSFAQLLELPSAELPLLDIIVMHGVYSWVSRENRERLIRFLDRQLKPGGIVYVSYNCMPGWAAILPFQRLLLEHASRTRNPPSQRFDAALAHALRLRDASALYYSANPSVQKRIETLAGMPDSYLTHEYLQSNWQPLYHLDVVQDLRAARLDYVCSATIADNIERLCVPEPFLPLLAEAIEPDWRQFLIDIGSNKFFRKDVFVRGSVSMNPREVNEAIGSQNLALLTPRSKVSFTFKCLLGDVEGQKAVYQPIVDALAVRPHSIKELASLPALGGQSATNIRQAVAMLVHSGQVAPVAAPVDRQAGAQAVRFNKAVAARALRGDASFYVAAPLLGSGLTVTYVDLLALHCLYADRKAQVSDMVKFGWDVLERTGQRLIREGQTLQDPADNQEQLAVELSQILSEKLPIWQTVGVI